LSPLTTTLACTKHLYKPPYIVYVWYEASKNGTILKWYDIEVPNQTY